MDNPVPTPPELVFPENVRAFRYFSQRVLPAVYGDEISYYETLCKVVDYLNKMMANGNALNQNVQNLYDYVTQLYEILQKFMESGFDDYYAEQVVQWIDDHLTWIFTTVVRQVYFGLTLEGYFVAYIPAGWSDIVFDTGADYTLDTYGRLILRWDADSPYTVNQTPEKVRS